jgi:hypothetical protein
VPVQDTLVSSPLPQYLGVLLVLVLLYLLFPVLNLFNYTMLLVTCILCPISRTPLGGGDSTDRTSQANLRKLNFTNTLYQLAYSLVLLQHLNTGTGFALYCLLDTGHLCEPNKVHTKRNQNQVRIINDQEDGHPAMTELCNYFRVSMRS